EGAGCDRASTSDLGYRIAVSKGDCVAGREASSLEKRCRWICAASRTCVAIGRSLRSQDRRLQRHHQPRDRLSGVESFRGDDMAAGAAGAAAAVHGRPLVSITLVTGPLYFGSIGTAAIGWAPAP